MDGQPIPTQEGFETLEDYNRRQDVDQMTLFDLQDLTVRESNSLDRLNTDLKNAVEMYESAYKTNEVYVANAEKASEARKILKATKDQIDSQPSVRALKEKVSEIKSEIKEKKELLSECAQEVVRKSGNSVFEHNGQTYYVQTVAKVIKRNQ